MIRSKHHQLKLEKEQDKLYTQVNNQGYVSLVERERRKKLDQREQMKNELEKAIS